MLNNKLKTASMLFHLFKYKTDRYQLGVSAEKQVSLVWCSRDEESFAGCEVEESF